MSDGLYEIGMEMARLMARVSELEMAQARYVEPPDYGSFATLRAEMEGMLAEARALFAGASSAAEVAAETSAEVAAEVAGAIEAVAAASASASESVAETVGKLPEMLEPEGDTAPNRTPFLERKLFGS